MNGTACCLSTTAVYFNRQSSLLAQYLLFSPRREDPPQLAHNVTVCDLEYSGGRRLLSSGE